MYIKCRIENFEDIYKDLIREENKEEYRKIGKELFENNKREIMNNLDKYISPNGKIQVNSLEEDWFPKVDADIFLSHSHQDEEKAILLAGFLNKKFSIKTFIDSIIWKNSLDLLKKIDDEYNRTENGSYSYRGSTWAATNVNLILMMALTKMIDKCECAFFLETPNSLEISSSNDEKNTGSPWIYSEIEILNKIRKKPLKRFEHSLESLEIFKSDSFPQFRYELNLEKFYLVNLKVLKKWIEGDIYQNQIDEILKQFENSHNYKNIKSLDKLYKILEEKNE